MTGYLGAGHAGVQVAVMLEEVQMPPGLVGEVVSRTGLTALRAGVEAAALGLDVEVQPVGRYGGIQVLVLEDPGRFQAQAEGQNLGAVHVVPPVVVEVISWPSSGGEFHTQRRRASIWSSRSPSRDGEAGPGGTESCGQFPGPASAKACDH